MGNNPPNKEITPIFFVKKTTPLVFGWTWATCPVLANGNVKYGDADCARDYLIIAGGSETGTSSDLLYSKDRFCGQALGYCKEGNTAGSCTPTIGAVVSFTKPFIVGVITDDYEGTESGTTSTANRGFNLLYSQQPCLHAG